MASRARAPGPRRGRGTTSCGSDESRAALKPEPVRRGSPTGPGEAGVLRRGNARRTPKRADGSFGVEPRSPDVTAVRAEEMFHLLPEQPKLRRSWTRPQRFSAETRQRAPGHALAPEHCAKILDVRIEVSRELVDGPTGGLEESHGQSPKAAQRNRPASGCRNRYRRPAIDIGGVLDRDAGVARGRGHGILHRGPSGLEALGDEHRTIEIARRPDSAEQHRFRAPRQYQTHRAGKPARKAAQEAIEVSGCEPRHRWPPRRRREGACSRARRWSAGFHDRARYAPSARLGPLAPRRRQVLRSSVRRPHRPVRRAVFRGRGDRSTLPSRSGRCRAGRGEWRGPSWAHDAAPPGGLQVAPMAWSCVRDTADPGRRRAGRRRPPGALGGQAE